MIRIALRITAAALFVAKLLAAPASPDADKVWALEKAYWHYVQADDPNSYRIAVARQFLRLA